MAGRSDTAPTTGAEPHFSSNCRPAIPLHTSMTERLYYTDPYLREFDGTIVRAEPRDGRTLVTLDRTAFYPTSGGQPFDTGALGGFPVVDVMDADDGSVTHAIDGRVSLQPGQLVHGAISWARRFDHMQQHTGQHVLSAAFDR